MYDDILVPIDGSSSAEVALHHGIDLAQRTMRSSTWRT